MATSSRTKQCCSPFTAPKLSRSACRCDRLLKKTGATQCTPCTCFHSPGLHHQSVHPSGRAGAPCLSGMLSAIAHLAPLLDQVVKPCRDISYSNANQVLPGYAASGIFAERLPSQAASLPTTCYTRPLQATQSARPWWATGEVDTFQNAHRARNDQSFARSLAAREWI